MIKRTAVLGAAFGDEGKGHIVHSMAPDYDWVVRYSGGANAGHTIYRDGKKYVHNLLPSVDFRNERTKAFLGSGMVIDLDRLRNEIVEAKQDFPDVGKRIYVDPDAFVVRGEHKTEDKKINGHIGSTNRGIGPAYTAKMARSGYRLKDIWDRSSDGYYADIIYHLHELGVQFYHVPEIIDDLKKSSILYEGAQGVLLDLNHGAYPFVSCGDCTVAGIYANGFSFAPPTTVHGVLKVYATKVGEGPFPTEYEGEEAEALRRLGNEYGATTGRPRRVGALDLPALRYAIIKGGINSLIITKFDILNGCDKVKVCNQYEERNTFGNKITDPVCGKDFFKVSPKYIELNGWDDADALGPNVVDFIEYIELQTSVSVSAISCGTDTKNIHTFSK